QFLLPLYKRLAVRDAIASLREADVVGFSVYVWNIQLSLEVARRLKAERPDVLLIFGGPQVPDQAEAFLRENPWIDVACHGEGERVFLDLLERLPSSNWNGIGSISYVRDGRFFPHPRLPRTPDLSTIPSPYLEGVFGPLIETFPDERWLALWETNRG